MYGRDFNLEVLMLSIHGISKTKLQQFRFFAHPLVSKWRYVGPTEVYAMSDRFTVGSQAKLINVFSIFINLIISSQNKKCCWCLLGREQLILTYVHQAYIFCWNIRFQYQLFWYVETWQKSNILTDICLCFDLKLWYRYKRSTNRYIGPILTPMKKLKL